jgi:uncharacterized protein YoxC
MNLTWDAYTISVMIFAIVMFFASITIFYWIRKMEKTVKESH